jgi:5-deoxy-glucuronate isomerase
MSTRSLANETLAPGTCIVRNTAGRKGRTRAVAPGETAMRHLHYGRIVIEPGDAPIRFATGELETGLICLDGAATVLVDGSPYELGRYDSLYVPRDSSVEVAALGQRSDLAEIAAPVSRKHPVQFVRFEAVQKDPGLHFETGGPGAKRDLNILLGKNVQASRIMAGVTFSEPGNWTSWPPHEHAAMLEEAYLYVEMPPPGFGLQLVYTDSENPEVATIVREGDIVLMPKGYHPNVAAPGSRINFIWMMAAHREDVDRQYGVVNVHPDFAAVGSGLDKGRSEQK